MITLQLGTTFRYDNTEVRVSVGVPDAIDEQFDLAPLVASHLDRAACFTFLILTYISHAAEEGFIEGSDEQRSPWLHIKTDCSDSYRELGSETRKTLHHSRRQLSEWTIPLLVHFYGLLS